jgi:hypothetical protein
MKETIKFIIGVLLVAFGAATIIPLLIWWVMFMGDLLGI